MSAGPNSRSREERRRLFEEAQDIPGHIVYRLSRLGTIPFDLWHDCLQEGLLATWIATDTFDPDISSWRNWADLRSRGAIFDYLRASYRHLGIGRSASEESKERAMEFFVSWLQQTSGVPDFRIPLERRLTAEKIISRLEAGSSLSLTQKRILRILFEEDLTQREIARRLDRNESRVSQAIRELAFAARRMALA